MGVSQDLYKKARKIIPGGTQLLSKRPEMFLPDIWPAYYKKAKGCEVWDLDGKKYIDASYMGIGSCILGYADADVNKAVDLIVKNGSMCTLNSPDEVELADVLIGLHPWAGMVRFARTGGEAMAIAIRIARASTSKDIVLFCGYHGWSDWYLSSNLADERSLDGHLLSGLHPKGVPRGLKGTSYPFKYNDTEAFLELVNKYKKEVGVVVLESVRNHYPNKEFLSTIRRVTKENGIVLVLDEITAAWRLNIGGAHLLFNVTPDIAVFAKGISNGYPMAAIIGTKDVMDISQDTFISSTYWTEGIGPAAALATIKKLKANNVPAHLVDIGKRVQEGWKSMAYSNKLDIEISGIYPLSHFSFKYKEPLVLKTLFTQLMLESGFLATTGFYTSYAHKDEHIKGYLKAANKAFAFISKAIKEGKPERYLNGPVCHSGFKRLT